jgi:hypothetical protein
MIEGQLYAGELVAWWCEGFEDHKYLTVGVVNAHTQPEESRVYVRTMFGSTVLIKRADLIRAPFVLAADVVKVQPETPRDPLADFPVGSFVVWTESGCDTAGVVFEVAGRKAIRVYGETDEPGWQPMPIRVRETGLRLCDPVKENRVWCYKIDPASWVRLIEGSLTGHATEVRVEGGAIPPDAVFDSVNYGSDSHRVYMVHPTFSPVSVHDVANMRYPHGGKITVTISKGDTEDA